METSTADSMLREAAEAWSALKIAESHIGRLNRYESLSPAMKADRMRHITNASAARTTLDRILRVRA